MAGSAYSNYNILDSTRALKILLSPTLSNDIIMSQLVQEVDVYAAT